MRKPKVDQTLCIGNEACVTIVPLVFKRNKEGKAYVVDSRGKDEETINYVIKQCPSQTISWV
ncbi:MAG: Ferredoxin [Thermoproteota archaeon]|nr:Ferredoxin [Thermoproteota archaeon]